MKILDWENVKKRYEENPFSFTKDDKKFKISKVTDTAIYINLPSGDQYISKKNLEKAVQLINNGIFLEGPSDYKRLVYDQRSSYAWAILNDMGLI